jgi:hypothetical protein
MDAVNRRRFLSSGLLTAGGLVASTALGQRAITSPGLPPKDPTPPHTPPVRIGSGGVNTSLLASAESAKVIMMANTYASQVRAADWATMCKASQSVSANLKSVGFDASIKALAAQVEPAQLNPAYLDKQMILSAIQVHQPTFSMANLEANMNCIPLDPHSISVGLTALRSQGLTPQIDKQANIEWQMENYIGKGGWVLSGSVAGIKANPAVEGPVAGIVATPDNPQPHPQQPNRKEGGGGGYSCETDDVAQFAVATIIGVVAIMAAPEVAGVLAGGAALSYFLGWSTVGMIAWGAGHLMVC